MKPKSINPKTYKLRKLTQSISLALIASTTAHSAEFIVTTTGDPGGGTPIEISPGVFEIDTLRSAIQQADNESIFPGADTIGFADSLFVGGEAEVNLNIIGDSFVFGGSGTSNSAFGINSEITVIGPTAATLRLIAGDLRHFQVNEGGHLNLSHVTLDGGFVPDNSSGRGGSIYVRDGSSTNISHCTFTNNSARTGGALNFNSGDNGETSTVTNSRFMLNQANLGGAVFQNSLAPLIIAKSVFFENSSSREGGALFTSGNLIVDSSTINNNVAGSGGGGISVNNVGTLTLTNSTVTLNQAGNRGGGIELGTAPDDGINTITNSTITDNQSRFESSPQSTNRLGDDEIRFETSGGGLFAYGYVGNDNLVIHNSIIVGNTESTAMLVDDVAALIQSDSSHNLIGAGDSIVGITDGQNNNQIGTREFPLDAQLQPLADNGGFTLTQLPNPGSPVIDAGDNALCESVDQLGALRPADGDADGSAVCDIGAVEVGGIPDLIFKDGFD